MSKLSDQHPSPSRVDVALADSVRNAARTQFLEQADVAKRKSAPAAIARGWQAHSRDAMASAVERISDATSRRGRALWAVAGLVAATGAGLAYWRNSNGKSRLTNRLWPPRLRRKR